MKKSLYQSLTTVLLSGQGMNCTSAIVKEDQTVHAAKAHVPDRACAAVAS